MPIEEFLKSLELPKKYYDSNFDIVEKYEEEADSFISGLEKIEADEFPEDKREKIIDMLKKISPNIEANIHRILDVFKYYEGADPKRAQVVTPDVGIVASADILAADQACVDMVFAMKEEDHKALTERMLSRHSMRQLSYMKELGMGNDRYRLIDLDNDDAVIDAAKAVKGVVPFGQVRKIKYNK